MSKLIELKDLDGNICYPNDIVAENQGEFDISIKYANGTMINYYRRQVTVSLEYYPVNGISRCASFSLGNYKDAFKDLPCVTINFLPFTDNALITWACPYGNRTRETYPKLIIAGFVDSKTEITGIVTAMAIGHWK